MSQQNKYKRTPKEPPQKKGSSEVVNQIVSNDEKSKESKSRKTKKATFLLDESLHKELRIYAAMNDTSMLDVVEKALKNHLKE